MVGKRTKKKFLTFKSYCLEKTHSLQYNWCESLLSNSWETQPNIKRLEIQTDFHWIFHSVEVKTDILAWPKSIGFGVRDFCVCVCAIHYKINILLSFRTRKIPNIQSWYGKWKQFPTVGRQNMSLVTEIHLFWFPVVKVFLVLQKIETQPGKEAGISFLER